MQEGVADIAEGDPLARLRPLLGDDTGKADLALDYIEKRAGLLLGQGERGRQRQYTFPHRTFQEYLAACHLAGRHDFCQKASDLAHANAAHWREVLTLAARHAKAGRGVPSADALIRCQGVESWVAKQPASEGDWRAAIVSWYEALAFCRWLSEELKLNVTLPSEAEWERAARHTDGRVYPWGNEDEAPQRCNMDETGIVHTSPVGMFPNGHAHCGAADMAGNVWEWCRTQHREDYKNYEKEVNNALDGEAARVLRGGAFYFDRIGVRCACRIGLDPGLRNWLIGFR